MPSTMLASFELLAAASILMDIQACGDQAAGVVTQLVVCSSSVPAVYAA
jgi:hypothetical protein